MQSAFHTIWAALWVFALITFVSPGLARADLDVLRESIIAYNVEHLKQSLADGSYRGEAGMLRIKPEVGKSLHLRVYEDDDYRKGKSLYRKADELFEAAVEAMTDRRKGGSPEEQAEKIGSLGVSYNETRRSAREHMMAYASRLQPGMDERLDEALCSRLMLELLGASLAKTANNLREALADFYNRCQDVKGEDGSLSTENVQFVNQVFREFISRSGESTLRQFDLDRPRGNPTTDLSDGWRRALGSKASYYARMVESMMQMNGRQGVVDVILFLALMRQESSFNHRNISSVGAVGLTQIMPRTAKDLGMENIYMPPYLDRAGVLLRKERRLKYRARSLISQMTPENKIDLAVRARKYVLDAAASGDRARDLYGRYRREVLNQGLDDRLDPEKSIRYGYLYFERMMKIQDEDISLALASYNAGPHRVKQYQGIPPYDETVKFRNRVIRFYREYLRRVERFQENNGEDDR